jgi:2',3'-cyclic-nucleotide 2'-phosphodiesterase (5'-nucleotidase family)
MFLLTLPLATLPWGDVNFLIVTDVHSWVAGHLHPDHDPMLDANYGHLLSMHEHLAAAAAARGRDLFFVDNGDLNDGTGFSRKPPAALVPLLRRMPFDALTTGNHELYENENIDFLAQPDETQSPSLLQDSLMPSRPFARCSHTVHRPFGSK